MYKIHAKQERKILPRNIQHAHYNELLKGVSKFGNFAEGEIGKITFLSV